MPAVEPEAALSIWIRNRAAKNVEEHRRDSCHPCHRRHRCRPAFRARQLPVALLNAN